MQSKFHRLLTFSVVIEKKKNNEDFYEETCELKQSVKFLDIQLKNYYISGPWPLDSELGRTMPRVWLTYSSVDLT